MKNLKAGVVVAWLATLAIPGVCYSEDAVEARFGTESVTIIREASLAEAFELHPHNVKSYPEQDETGRSRTVWPTHYGIVGEGRTLSAEILSNVQELLLDPSAFYDPPKEGTLMCLFIPSNALRLSTEHGVVVAVFEGNCSRVRLVSEEGNPLGSGLLESAHRDIWESLFYEIFAKD